MAFHFKRSFFFNLVLIIVGICVGLLLLEISLRAAGFLILSIQTYDGNNQKSRDTFRILTIGESTTANLRNGGSSWPEELETILNSKNKSVTFIVSNEAIPGTNTDVLISKLESNLDKHSPNLVIAMMGTNDELFLNLSMQHAGENPFVALIKKMKTYKLIRRGIEGISYNQQSRKEQQEILEEMENKKEREFQLLQQLKEDFPYNLMAIIDLGNFYLNNSNLSEAEKYTELMIANLPNNSAAHRNAGIFYEAKGDYRKAELFYKKSIVLNPNDMENFMTLGRLYKAMNRSDEALPIYIMYENAAAQNPQWYDDYVYRSIAELYRETNRTGHLYKVLKVILKNRPDKIKEVDWVGEIYEELNQTNEAIGIFQDVLTRYPQNYAAQAELVIHYLKNNQSSEVERIMQQVTDADRVHAILFYENLAERYESMGNASMATSFREKHHEARKADITATRENFRKLYNMTHARSIPLIVMQYPTLDIESFKEYF